MVNGFEIPVELFVRRIAPAMNTMEEVGKKTPLDKWNVKVTGSYQQRATDEASGDRKNER